MEDLYQSEAFLPLGKFLSSCVEQLTYDLLVLDYTKPEAVIQAARLTAQANLVGTISKLPTLIKEFKTAQEQIELRQQQFNLQSYDPLNKE